MIDARLETTGASKFTTANFKINYIEAFGNKDSHFGLLIKAVAFS